MRYVKILLFLVLLALIAKILITGPHAQTSLTPPVSAAPWSSLNPDMAGIVSNDPSAGATAVTISNPPAAGSTMVLRVASAMTGQLDLSHQVASSDTLQSIGQDFCDQINANQVLKAGNIACQFQGGAIVGVTNFTNNIAFVTPLTAGFVVNHGSPANDAGPIFYLKRVPPTPPVPPASVGQLFFAGIASDGRDIQYGTIIGTVVDPNPASIGGSLGFFTAATQFGSTNIAQRMNIWRGVQVCEESVCPADYGNGTLSVQPSHADGSGPGLFIGGRKVCAAPRGTVGPGGIRYDNYLYLAEGSACPPGG